MVKQHYTVQIVEHVNYIAYVKANSQEHAEQLVIEDVNSFDWIKMEGGNSCEVCLSNDEYEETNNLKGD